MDTLSQITLGAAVGGAVLGRRAGLKAFAWGAVCGMLPDLDVLVPLGDPVRDFTYHRSFSHALFFQTLAAPLLAWLILRLHPAERPRWRSWLGLVWLALITHSLLDAFTVYGTQLLLPFSDYPVGLGSIFIIDPLYTLPLLAGVVLAVRGLRRRRPQALRWNRLGLLLSSAYLAYTAAAQAHVEAVSAEALAAQGLEPTARLATPTAFNSLLWRVVAVDEDGYYEGYYSLLDPDRSLHLRRHPSRSQLLAGLDEHWAVERLRWFTKGFYRVREDRGQVTVTDLRMGQEPFYVFSFVVGERGADGVEPVPSRRHRLPPPSPEQLLSLWGRIWDRPAPTADSR